RSVVVIPQIKRPDSPNRGPEGTLTFTYYAPSGETVTVAGSFNRWDPFMYQLKETSPGRYTLSLPLPPGTYQYTFFHRGERRLDPNNSRRVYTRDGKAANEAVVK
ncbi:MAG: glycogen-binding domain-containing protein, partial [Treponema sp.]|nr:glycogen-binding domain-containing protein [Treponema sp.]